MEVPSIYYEIGKDILGKNDHQVPYATRLEYIKSVAAIKLLCASDLKRRCSDNKASLADVLVRAVKWQSMTPRNFDNDSEKLRSVHH